MRVCREAQSWVRRCEQEAELPHPDELPTTTGVLPEITRLDDPVYQADRAAIGARQTFAFRRAQLESANQEYLDAIVEFETTIEWVRGERGEYWREW